MHLHARHRVAVAAGRAEQLAAAAAHDLLGAQHARLHPRGAAHRHLGRAHPAEFLHRGVRRAPGQVHQPALLALGHVRPLARRGLEHLEPVQPAVELEVLAGAAPLVDPLPGRELVAVHPDLALAVEHERRDPRLARVGHVNVGQQVERPRPRPAGVVAADAQRRALDPGLVAGVHRRADGAGPGQPAGGLQRGLARLDAQDRARGEAGLRGPRPRPVPAGDVDVDRADAFARVGEHQRHPAGLVVPQPVALHLAGDRPRLGRRLRVAAARHHRGHRQRAGQHPAVRQVHEVAGARVRRLAGQFHAEPHLGLRHQPRLGRRRPVRRAEPDAGQPERARRHARRAPPSTPWRAPPRALTCPSHPPVHPSAW